MFCDGTHSTVGVFELAAPIVAVGPEAIGDALLALGVGGGFEALGSHLKPGGLLEVPTAIEVIDVVGLQWVVISV